MNIDNFDKRELLAIAKMDGRQRRSIQHKAYEWLNILQYLESEGL